jgi:hypothetical protein
LISWCHLEKQEMQILGHEGKALPDVGGVEGEVVDMGEIISTGP